MGCIPELDIRVSEAVIQFVFSNYEILLLISTPSKDIVWELKGKGKRGICSRQQGKREYDRWVLDSFNPEIFLWIDCEKVCSYTSSTLTRSVADHATAPDTSKRTGGTGA